jgi:hypothetical protein
VTRGNCELIAGRLRGRLCPLILPPGDLGVNKLTSTRELVPFRKRTDDGFWLNGIHFIIEYGPRANTLVVDFPSFVLMKSEGMLAEYDRQLKSRSIENMLELGVMRGGGTAYFNTVFKPKRHLAVDYFKQETGLPKLVDMVAREKRELYVRQDMGQQQTEEIIGLFEDTFKTNATFDFIVDDASHAYELSLASFNGLFPRMRPGGIYAIEDWGWAHWAHFQDPSRQDYTAPALSNLVTHCVLAMTAGGSGISRVEITADTAFIHRDDTLIKKPLEIERAYPTRGRSIPVI